MCTNTLGHVLNNTRVQTYPCGVHVTLVTQEETSSGRTRPPHVGDGISRGISRVVVNDRQFSVVQLQLRGTGMRGRTATVSTTRLLSAPLCRVRRHHVTTACGRFLDTLER